jgi:hypothetical protein
VVESGHILIVRSCLASSTSTSISSSNSNTTANTASNTTNSGQSEELDPGVASASKSSVPDGDDLSGSYLLDSDVIGRVLSVVASGGRPYSRRQALYAQSCNVAFDLHLWTSSPTTTTHAPPRVHRAFDPVVPFSSQGEGTSKAAAAQSVPGVFSLGLGGTGATVGLGKGGGGSNGTGRAKSKAAKGLVTEPGGGFAFGAKLSSSIEPPVRKQSCCQRPFMKRLHSSDESYPTNPCTGREEEEKPFCA